MTDWNDCPAVESVSDRLSGAWVFTDTRVPVSALFGNLAEGATVQEFLEWFPGLTSPGMASPFRTRARGE